MKRESFVFYRSFFEAIRKLNKRDQATIYSQICRYALDGEIDELTGVPAAIFDLIKPQIDANLRRYENGTKGGEYGKLGGRPKTPKKPLKNPKQTPNVNVNENVNDNENVNVNVNASGSDETTNTRPPTVREVIQEAKELGHHMTEIEAQKFIDYNESLGWKMKPSYALPKWFENRSYKNRSPAGKFANFPINHENDELRKMIIAQELGDGT